MNSKKQHNELYGKLVCEQSLLKEWLLQQELEEILKHTYEYTLRFQRCMVTHTTMNMRKIRDANYKKNKQTETYFFEKMLMQS